MNNVTKFAKWFFENFHTDCMACSYKVTTSATRIGRMLLKLQLPLEELQYVARFTQKGTDGDRDPVYDVWFLGCGERQGLFSPEALIAELEYLTGEKADTPEKRQQINRCGENLVQRIAALGHKQKEDANLALKWSLLNVELTAVKFELQPILSAIAARIGSSESWDEKLRKKVEERWKELNLDKLPVPKAPKP